MTVGTLLHAAGTAAAPHGWRDLVAREPRHLRRGLKPCHPILSEPDFHWVLGQQRDLMRVFFYRPDVAEHWQRPSWERLRLALGGWRWMLAGDCEDFALELRARLEARIAPGALRLVQCWTERGTAHLVLALDTTNRGTLIADNRRPLQHWADSGYHFLGGVSEVPGRQLWAWNIRAPSLATTLADLLKPRGET